ncbi:MAG: aminoacetone oxidase family FAD-binding enzyme [Burkholderiaceae bacterium]
MSVLDAVVIGAGAAGMFCAGVAGRRGARVLVVDHAATPGEKIRISGGGRCNFTNLDGDRVERYACAVPRFVRHALRAYPPRRFVELVRGRGIAFHEKHRGQLFCDDSSERIVELLREEALAGGVRWQFPSQVRAVRAEGIDGGPGFAIDTDQGTVRARALVVATGGLSVPKIGASDLGYRIARQFGHAIVEPRPALVPLTFDAAGWQPFAGLAGVSLPVGARTPADPAAPAFAEDLLFTHRGLSGPAILQVSTFWRPGDPIEIDLVAGRPLQREWVEAKREVRATLQALLQQALPRRLAQLWLERFLAGHPGVPAHARPGEIGNRELEALVASLRRWRVVPSGTEGWRKAEVTAGGVSCAELDARTLQSLRVPGLHFIGEVVDVTGWLGGYNFQWAWSSAYAAAHALAP